jgi:hypothetical protein
MKLVRQFAVSSRALGDQPRFPIDQIEIPDAYESANRDGHNFLRSAAMRIKPYVGIAIWAVILWAIGMLVVYGFFYFGLGVKFWHPLQ